MKSEKASTERRADIRRDWVSETLLPDITNIAQLRFSQLK